MSAEKPARKPLTTPRLWFYMDSLFHEQPVVAVMRDSFGGAGPYTLVVLLCEAYKRYFLRSAEPGVVDMTYGSLAHLAGLRDHEEALAILQYLTSAGILQPEGCALGDPFDDLSGSATFRVRFLKWDSWTPRDPNAAERKARSRAANPLQSLGSQTVTPGHTEVEVDIDSQGQDKGKPVREDVVRLSHLLADLIRKRDPKAHVAPDDRRWLDAVRLLIDKDGRTPAEVEHVIRWCQADTKFWAGNILSTPKLRDKFTMLYAKAGKPKGNADDFFERNGM